MIDRFHPAIELIDPRGLKMAPDMIPAAVALNILNAGIVLGANSVAPDQLDITSMTMTLDGARAVQVTDNAPQHPVDAVMWLLHNLAQRGLRTEPGIVVMCGTHVPLWPLDPDIQAVDVEMSGLGSVSFRLQG